MWNWNSHEKTWNIQKVKNRKISPSNKWRTFHGRNLNSATILIFVISKVLNAQLIFKLLNKSIRTSMIFCCTLEIWKRKSVAHESTKQLTENQSRQVSSLNKTTLKSHLNWSNQQFIAALELPTKVSWCVNLSRVSYSSPLSTQLPSQHDVLHVMRFVKSHSRFSDHRFSMKNYFHVKFAQCFHSPCCSWFMYQLIGGGKVAPTRK